MNFLRASMVALLILSSAALAADSEVLLFDDMLVEKRAIENPPLEIRGAVKIDAVLWTDGVLPVTFAKGITREQKSLFFQACQAWSKVANVRCVEGRYRGKTLKVSNRYPNCWALWGMGTHFLVLKRMMNLQNSKCWRQETLMHEMGHAFGLIHEHQRVDRDEFIEVHTENASRSYFGLNTKINLGPQAARALTPYDFSSIMHYGRRAFSVNGRDTIVPKPGYEQFADVIGRASQPSEYDAAAMAALYGPPAQ